MTEETLILRKSVQILVILVIIAFIAGLIIGTKQGIKSQKNKCKQTVYYGKKI